MNSINSILSFLYKKFTVEKWSHAKTETPNENVKMSRDRTGAIAHWLEVFAVKSEHQTSDPQYLSLVFTGNQA